MVDELLHEALRGKNIKKTHGNKFDSIDYYGDYLSVHSMVIWTFTSN